MKKGMATVWAVTITILVMLTAGCGSGYYYLKYYEPEHQAKPDQESQSDDVEDVQNKSSEDKSATENSSSVDTSHWKTLTFDSGESIKYPSSWAVKKSDINTSEYINYSINESAKGGSGSIFLYNLDEWLKGPGPDDGYVLDTATRQKAYETLSSIYQDRKLSAANRVKLNDYNLEFFTYSNYYRAFVNYRESNDGKWRGFTMVNSSGQDIGLSSDYVISLFNLTSKKVINIYMPLTDEFSEIKDLQSKFGNYTVESNELERINTEVHQDFVELMQADPSELSFYSFMQEIDAAAKSIK